MKKFLLLALLIGLPSPLFAGESTSGYKKNSILALILMVTRYINGLKRKVLKVERVGLKYVQDTALLQKKMDLL